MTIAAKKEGSLLDFNQAVKSGMGFAGTFKGTGLQYGALWKSNITKFVPANNNVTMYFNHKTDKNVAGAEITYDHDAKSFKTCLGLQMKENDHTWKFKFHNSGLMRAALQWQLHKVAKATLNTSVNLQDIPAGSIKSLPLNLTLEVKY